MQDCSNSIANAMELLQSCTKPLIIVSFIISQWWDGAESLQSFLMEDEALFIIHTMAAWYLAMQAARASAAAVLSYISWIACFHHHEG